MPRLMLRMSNSKDRSFGSLEAIEVVLLGHLGFPFFGVLLHFFHPLISSLLQFIDWIEYLLLVTLIQRFLILLHFLEHFLPILRLLLLQLFESLLEFAVLPHRDVVVHIEVALISVILCHERTQSASWFMADPLEIFDDAFVFLLDFSLHLFD